MVTDNKGEGLVHSLTETGNTKDIRNHVISAGRWLKSAQTSDPMIEKVSWRLLVLADHSSWQIRKEIVHASSHGDHEYLEFALVKLSDDDNSYVSETAQRILKRKQKWFFDEKSRNQQQRLIDGTLDEIQKTHGISVRALVERVSGQMKDSFVREAYHEMVRAISSIESLIDIIKENLANSTDSLSEETIEHVDNISTRIRYLENLLRSLRAYTLSTPPLFAEENILEVVREATMLVKSANGSKDIIFEERFEFDGVCEISRSRLIQALTNVLQNAVDAYEDMDSTSLVQIFVSESSESDVSIKIKDYGCGMTQDRLDKSFLLYSSSKKNGIGLGIPLSCKIIRNEHRGKFDIDSTRHLGTSINISIPIVHGKNG